MSEAHLTTGPVLGENLDGQLGLGSMYKFGPGVPQDLALAHMWFNLLAGSGSDAGRLSRDVAERLMTSVQIAEAQRLAREWLEARQ